MKLFLTFTVISCGYIKDKIEDKKVEISQTQAKIEKTEKKASLIISSYKLQEIIVGAAKKIQSFCMTKEEAPSLKELGEIIKNSDIEIKKVELKYLESEFECQGYIDISIASLKVNINKLKFPLSSEEKREASLWEKYFE